MAIAFPAFSQTTPAVQPDSVFDFPEKLAEFPGGYAALAAYNRSVFPLPPTCHSRSWVIVRAVIDRAGAVREVRILKNPGDAVVAQKTVELISKMPRWQPATHDNQAVACRVTFPVRVCLEE